MATELVRRLLSELSESVLSQWRTGPESRSKDRRDLVTTVDLEVEQRLRDELGHSFPEHGLRGEELGTERPEAGYQWLIDPIDGTKNYAAHSSLFALSVALVKNDEPLLGVIHNVTAAQTFHAYKGGGSFADEERLAGPQVGDLGSVLVNVDTPKSSDLGDDERQWFEEKLVLLTRRLYRVRALGVASLAAGAVASGALDAYVDLTGYAQPEDVAAGRIVMSEAGVRVEAIDVGVGPPRLLAAPPALWEGLRSTLCVQG